MDFILIKHIALDVGKLSVCTIFNVGIVVFVIFLEINLEVYVYLNEIKNQHVHMFWGLISSYLFFPFAGTCVGVIIEIYQFIYKKEGLKLYDRILDITFWTIGSIIGSII